MIMAEVEQLIHQKKCVGKVDKYHHHWESRSLNKSGTPSKDRDFQDSSSIKRSLSRINSSCDARKK